MANEFNEKRIKTVKGDMDLKEKVNNIVAESIYCMRSYFDIIDFNVY